MNKMHLKTLYEGSYLYEINTGIMTSIETFLKLRNGCFIEVRQQMLPRRITLLSSLNVEILQNSGNHGLTLADSVDNGQPLGLGYAFHCWTSKTEGEISNWHMQPSHVKIFCSATAINTSYPKLLTI